MIKGGSIDWVLVALRAVMGTIFAVAAIIFSLMGTLAHNYFYGAKMRYTVHCVVEAHITTVTRSEKTPRTRHVIECRERSLYTNERVYYDDLLRILGPRSKGLEQFSGTVLPLGTRIEYDLEYAESSLLGIFPTVKTFMRADNFHIVETQ